MWKVLWELQEGRGTSKHGCPEIRQLGEVVWSPETLCSRSALPCLKCGKQETTPCRICIHCKGKAEIWPKLYFKKLMPVMGGTAGITGEASECFEMEKEEKDPRCS